jgi:hypothetical protein
MAVPKIVPRVKPGSLDTHKPPDVELGPDQGALIPFVGDKILADEFVMIVGERKFQFQGDTLWVFLEEH